ncbi:hypothetical protein DPMN_137210 [Dreissena polymorpha]|uniref:Uncharacterized protein n=1 Tax=Dreissena polymorpha TaxID=45954 RepID=A0A9D4JDF1_DREPO|nr:hypothetical protein DPMN_137210 [Dreissena polymorpha]
MDDDDRKSKNCTLPTTVSVLYAGRRPTGGGDKRWTDMSPITCFKWHESRATKDAILTIP